MRHDSWSDRRGPKTHRSNCPSLVVRDSRRRGVTKRICDGLRHIDKTMAGGICRYSHAIILIARMNSARVIRWTSIDTDLTSAS